MIGSFDVGLDGAWSFVDLLGTHADIGSGNWTIPVDHWAWSRTRSCNCLEAFAMVDGCQEGVGVVHGERLFHVLLGSTL